MSYNKKVHLRANIEAIKLVFALDKENRPITEAEQNILMQYSGFGGLKCVLNPANSLTDTAHWAKSELELFSLVAELHRVIKDNTLSEQEYKNYINSIKNSVLTAFYTPPEVVQTIADAIKDNGIVVNRFLDPSAGMGEFASAFSFTNLQSENICFEKDLLTGKILSYISPDNKIKVEGFEKIESRYNNYFDVVSSNIPFGDIKVFDTAFMKQGQLYQDSTKTIHNYFFVKGVDALREGGLLAFITSQGVMNSPGNESVRKWLMDKTNLVSAIRLPNNLFSNYAGTEVGSDLIVLQKNTQKDKLLNLWEELFITSSKSEETEIYNNDYFYNFGRVVQTKSSIDTDPYGKPVQVFIHEGAIEEIADTMGQMLKSDLKSNLNLDLYNQYTTVQKQKEPSVLQTKSKKEKTTYKALEVNISEPVMSLYDLFGFTQEERTQVKPVKGNKKRIPLQGTPVQLTLFSSSGKQKSEQQKQSLDLRPFSGELKEHHREGSLIEDIGQIGFLKERYKDGAVFQPLDLPFIQHSKISSYIKIRDTYHQLYNYEALKLDVNDPFRKELNLAYDSFVSRYGNLNDKKNLDVIKMDAGGKEILYLERAVEGKLQRADIFHQPVAFNPNDIKVVATSEEALIASLNKYGEVKINYMLSLMEDKSREELISDLHGHIYFNPLVQNEEVRDRFIAGNVIEKAEAIEWYVLNHPDELRSQTSLKALQDAIPQPIRFEELDFNFGERWIPSDIYKQYVDKLFDTDVSIDYYASRDDFMVKADRSNLIINEKFAVKSESRLYTGIHLLKNALLNTTPAITKTIEVIDKVTGEQRKVKVSDPEALQLANTKIDEIRNGFSDWLNGQSPEFKDKLADMYNRKFNCYVRPEYDGSHQTFPNLDLKRLGIEALYPSQKNCIWQIKLNNGAIADHEVLRP